MKKSIRRFFGTQAAVASSPGHPIRLALLAPCALLGSFAISAVAQAAPESDTTAETPSPSIEVDSNSLISGDAGDAATSSAADASAAEAMDTEETPPSVETSGEAADVETGAADEAESGQSELADDEAEHAPPHKLKHVQIPKAGKTQMWVRNTTFFDYFGNNYNPQTNDDQFMALVNYLNFGTTSRMDKWKLATMARLDTHKLFNGKKQPLCDTNGDLTVDSIEAQACNYEDDIRIERLQLRVETKHVKVTLGDFNVNFGRGIALSVRKINDIGIDATIKGGRLDIKTKPLTITALAGVGNRQQSEYASRLLYKDPGYAHSLCDAKAQAFTTNSYGNRLWTTCSDIITATRIETKLPGKIRLGTHYGFLWFGTQNDGQNEALHLVGGDIGRARIGKFWDIFVGATALMRNYHQRENFPDLTEDGIALYVQNLFSRGKTSVLVEGKYYDNYVVARDVNPVTVQYAEIPTLERADQQPPAGANTAGGRIRIDHTLGDSGLTLYGNFMGYAYALTNHEEMFSSEAGGEGRMVMHGFAGFLYNNRESGFSVQGSGGYRWEGYQKPFYTDQARYERKLPAADIYLNKALGAYRGLVHSISFRGDWRYEKVQKGVTHKFGFHRGNLILGYGLAPYVTFAFIGGFSSEFPALEGEPQLHDQPCEGDESACLRKPHLWPGGEVRLNFLSNSFVRVFGGRQVGGLLCVNGSCRVLPDFEGVRADLVLGF